MPMKTSLLFPDEPLGSAPRRRITLAAALLPLASIAQAPAAVVGSGKLQSEVRAVGGFEAVTLRGSMNVVLRQGQRVQVEVRADDNLLPLIETRVVTSSGLPTLQIGGKPGASYSTRNQIAVTVDLVSLKALILSGSGDMSCDALKAQALNVALSGSGNLKLAQLDAEALVIKVSGSGDAQLSGRAARVDAAVSGSGNLTAGALQADDVDVRLHGSGDAGVNARRTLKVAIAGSGDVTHSGGAAVTRSITGSGSLNKR
jgi:hypothetical protein